MDDLLYHYTSPAALMGIVQQGKLWCTSLGCLNDSKEWSHCFSQGISVANELIDAARPVVPTIILERQQQWLEGFIRHCGLYRDFDPAGLNYYVASLSEKRDDLSQWRAYGLGGGVCLGFDQKKNRRIG